MEYEKVLPNVLPAVWQVTARPAKSGVQEKGVLGQGILSLLFVYSGDKR